MCTSGAYALLCFFKLLLLFYIIIILYHYYFMLLFYYFPGDTLLYHILAHFVPFQVCEAPRTCQAQATDYYCY